MESDDKQEYELDFQAIAADWYAALSPTAYSPYSYKDARDRLSVLARDATRLLLNTTYQPADAEKIGASLAELNYIQGDALGISIKVLSDVWQSSSPIIKQAEKYRRMTMLMGDAANGYYKAATFTILKQQESIREAQMVTLKELHADLQNQRDLLHLTAERLQTLHDVESGILATQSAEAIADIAITHIMRIIPCRSASIVTIDFARDVFVVLASKNTPEEPGNLLPLSLTTQARLKAFAENKSLIINDISALENRPPDLDYLYARGTRSILYIPFLAMGQLIGLLSLESAEVGAFTEQHDVIAQQVADSVAVALHNRSLLETEKRARQESETLREVAASLSSSLEREELLDYILIQVGQVVPYDGAVILLQTEDKMQVVAQRGFNQIAIKSLNNLDELPANIRRLIAQRSPLIISDTQKDPDWIRITGSSLERCWLWAPLLSQGIFIGLLGLSKNEPDYYQQSAVDLVLTFANHAAVALENARLYREIQQHAETLQDHVAARTRDLSSLYEIAAISSKHLDLQNVLEAGLTRILDDLLCPSGAVHLFDKGNEDPYLVTYKNLSPAQLKHIEQISADDPLLQKLLASQGPVIVTDSKAEPNFKDFAVPAFTGSTAGTVMRVRNEAVGILYLYFAQPHQLTQDEIKLFEAIAEHLGIAIDNAELRKQAEQVAVIEERERLARDLHDSATQSLFSLTLFAAAAREKVQAGQLDRALQYLDDIRFTANQTHREMRLLLYELGSSEPAAGESLELALERRLRAVEGRSGIHATFRPLYAGSLTFEIEQALYQIANEALNNALKYAGGTSVTVEISSDGAEIILSVKDNGKGFDLQVARDGAGMGLSNMRLRAASIGGTLSIRTSTGQGTEIVVQIPRDSVS